MATEDGLNGVPDAAIAERPTPGHGLVACPGCDLLIREMPVAAGELLICPRCGHVVREGKPDSVLRALVFSTAGIILFAPAMALPLLSMSILGLRQDASMTQALLALFQGGYPEVAFAVMICAMLAPFANLWLMFSVSLALYREHRPRWLMRLLRLNHKVREWAMLEVFLLGVLVSVIKLKDMAQLLPGPGLYCFMGLMLATLMLEGMVDEHEFWQEFSDGRP